MQKMILITEAEWKEFERLKNRDIPRKRYIVFTIAIGFVRDVVESLYDCSRDAFLGCYERLKP